NVGSQAGARTTWHMDFPPGMWQEAPDSGASSPGSEFERPAVRGAELDAAIGIDGQGIPRPAAQVLDLLGFDLRERADAAQGTHDVFCAKRSLRVFERLEQRCRNGTFD